MDSPTVTDETATGTAAPDEELDPTSSTAAPEGEDTTDTPEGAEGKQDETTEPEKSAFEKKLDAILNDEIPAKEEGDEAKTSSDAEAETPKAAAEAAKGDEPLVARLPGRQPEDPELEVKFDAETRALLQKKGMDPQQLVERINQASNGYARRQQIEAERAEVEADRAELSHIEKEITERPVEFLVDKIDPSQYGSILEALATRIGEAEFDAFLEKVAGWESDPAERKVAAARAREEAATRKVMQRDETDRAKAKAEYTSAVASEIARLVPESMSDEGAAEFYDFAAHKLQKWAREQPKGTRLAPEDVPQVLADIGALEPYGLSLTKGKLGAGRTAGKAPAKAGDVAARAAARGKELKERRERRQNAVTVPAGAGSEAANTRPPKGQTFEQRISWIERFGIGK